MRTLEILNPKLAAAIKATEIPPPIADPVLRGTAIRNRMPVDEARIADFCRKHGIAELALFGSILRDDFRADSDIDFLVEFQPGRRVSLFDIGGMELELIEMLGREVDLRTRGDLGERIRGDIEANREVIYAGP